MAAIVAAPVHLSVAVSLLGEDSNLFLSLIRCGLMNNDVIKPQQPDSFFRCKHTAHSVTYI